MRESGPHKSDDDGDVDEDNHRDDDDGPDGVPAPPGERGREPPPSSSSLASPLDGRRVPPLLHGLHRGGWTRAPPRLDLSLSLCFLLFLCSQILAFHRFLNSRIF